MMATSAQPLCVLLLTKREQCFSDLSLDGFLVLVHLARFVVCILGLNLGLQPYSNSFIRIGKGSCDAYYYCKYIFSR